MGSRMVKSIVFSSYGSFYPGSGSILSFSLKQIGRLVAYSPMLNIKSICLMKVSRWASDLCPPLPELLSWKDGSVPLKKIISDDVLYIMFSKQTIHISSENRKS